MAMVVMAARGAAAPAGNTEIGISFSRAAGSRPVSHFGDLFDQMILGQARNKPSVSLFLS
jgi:hypothetical protein